MLGAVAVAGACCVDFERRDNKGLFTSKAETLAGTPDITLFPGVILDVGSLG